MCIRDSAWGVPNSPPRRDAADMYGCGFPRPEVGWETFWLSACVRTTISCSPLLAFAISFEPFSTTSSNSTGTVYCAAGPLAVRVLLNASLVEVVTELLLLPPMFTPTAPPAVPETFGFALPGEARPGARMPAPQPEPRP